MPDRSAADALRQAAEQLDAEASELDEQETQRWQAHLDSAPLAARPDPDANRAYAPGELAPSSGIFELLNSAGSPTATRVSVVEGKSLPSAPFGWMWRSLGT